MTTTPLAKPLATYAHARRVGDILFVAGQGCRDAITDIWAGVTFDKNGKAITTDFAAQVRGVLKNLDGVLQNHHLSKDHLVDVQVFLTDMTTQFPVMNEIWNEYFRNVKQPPTRTTVAVAGLPGLNLVEMKAIAAYS